MKKMFEMTGGPQKKEFKFLSPISPNKKFEMEQPKKKFEMEVEGPGRTAPEWHRQTNENDCGPCLILNVLQRIEGVRHVPRDISEVRREVNRLRRERGRPKLNSSGWFTSEDIGHYLNEVAGLNVEEYYCARDVAEETSRAIHDSLEQRPFEAIFSGAGRHFRGIMPSEDSYLLLDSLTDAPREETAESLNEMVGRSVYGADQERVERLGIVRRGEAGYNVKNF